MALADGGSVEPEPFDFVARAQEFAEPDADLQAQMRLVDRQTSAQRAYENWAAVSRATAAREDGRAMDEARELLDSVDWVKYDLEKQARAEARKHRIERTLGYLSHPFSRVA